MKCSPLLPLPLENAKEEITSDNCHAVSEHLGNVDGRTIANAQSSHNDGAIYSR